MSKSKTKRPNKGASIISLPHDYTVLEIKVTGFYPGYDEIIEVAALRIRNGQVADQFSSLSRISRALEQDFIEKTGITDIALASSPIVDTVVSNLLSFIGDDIVVGHGISMYVNFVYDISKISGKLFGNDHINTTRFAKKLYPELDSHRSNDLAKFKKIQTNTGLYRADTDALLTFELFEAMKIDALATFGDERAFAKSFTQKTHYSQKPKASDITTQNVEFDETHPLFSSNVAFTGTLERFVRNDAFQIVADFGGIPSGNVTKKTKYLVLAKDAYTATPSGKSKKHVTAEKYAASGQDITILPEDVFYDMVFDE